MSQFIRVKRAGAGKHLKHAEQSTTRAWTEKHSIRDVGFQLLSFTFLCLYHFEHDHNRLLVVSSRPRSRRTKIRACFMNICLTSGSSDDIFVLLKMGGPDSQSCFQQQTLVDSSQKRQTEPNQTLKLTNFKCRSQI